MGQYRFCRKTMSFIRDGTVALPSPKKCAFFFWDGNGTVHKRFRQSAMGQYRYRRKTMSFIRDGTVALPSPKKCAVFFWDGNGTVHKSFRQSAMGQFIRSKNNVLHP